MNIDLFLQICESRQCEKHLDATSEVHSNWMRSAMRSVLFAFSGVSWTFWTCFIAPLSLSAVLSPRSLRFVNCSRNAEEQNLVAFQYRGGILYRCCRPIEPGQELLVWYDEEYAKCAGITFDYIWNRKCSVNSYVTSFSSF